MDYRRWYPRYRRIAQALGLSETHDQQATGLLASLIRGRALRPEAVRRRMAGRRVVVLGAGPSLKLDLERLREAGLHRSSFLVSADGATTALLEAGFTPSLVVTDLDGRLEDIAEAGRHGALLTVHGHGDNIPALKSWVPRIEGLILGTTQVKPEGEVYNFGGFTDGDRGVFLAEEMGAREIILAGMDLGERVGRFSKPSLASDVPASLVKRLKLRIAKELLEWLSTWAEAELWNFTSGGEDIRGFPRLKS